MSKQFRRFMSLVLTLALMLGLAQNVASAAGVIPERLLPPVYIPRKKTPDWTMTYLQRSQT